MSMNFLSIYIVIVCISKYYKKEKIITNPPPFDSNKQNLERCWCGSI